MREHDRVFMVIQEPPDYAASLREGFPPTSPQAPKIVLPIPSKEDVREAIYLAFMEERKNNPVLPSCCILSAKWYAALDFDVRSIQDWILPPSCAVIVDHLMDDGLRFFYDNHRQMDRYIRRKYEETRRKQRPVRE